VPAAPPQPPLGLAACARQPWLQQRAPPWQQQAAPPWPAAVLRRRQCCAQSAGHLLLPAQLQAWGRRTLAHLQGSGAAEAPTGTTLPVVATDALRLGEVAVVEIQVVEEELEDTVHLFQVEQL
jgi:hypothetical protein